MSFLEQSYEQAKPRLRQVAEQLRERFPQVAALREDPRVRPRLCLQPQGITTGLRLPVVSGPD
jgi:hypothetical protein